MADLTDIIAEARSRLQDRMRTYTGVDAQTLTAIAPGFTRFAGSRELVSRELSQLCARMALDPDAFYDAVVVVGGKVLERVESTLSALEFLTAGPSSVLRWSRNTRSPELVRAEIEALQEAINRGRWARDELTQTINQDILDRAEEAATRLAELLSSDRDEAPVIPSITEIEGFLTLVVDLEAELNSFVTLETRYRSTNFRDLAIRRILEGVGADLDRYLVQLEESSTVDRQADADALASISALQASLEALLLSPETFGQLLILEALLDPLPLNTVANVLLEPVPTGVRGRRAFTAQLDEGVGLGSDERVLTTMVSDDWDTPHTFEQFLQIAHEEDVLSLGVITAAPDYVLSGTGTVVGEPLLSVLVSTTVFATPAALALAFPPAVAYVGLWGYVELGNGAEIYECQFDGFVYAWVALGTGLVDPYGPTRFLSTSGPLGPSGISPGDTFHLASTVFTGTRDVAQIGHLDPSNTFTEAFGVTFDLLVTATTGVAFTWHVDRFPLGTESTKWFLDTSTSYAGTPRSDLLNKSVLLRRGTEWTHRFITDVQAAPAPDEGYILTFDRSVPTTGQLELFRARLPGFEYPRSRYARLRTQDPEEALDILPGDVLFVDATPDLSSIDPLDPQTQITGVLGAMVSLDRAVIVHPDARQELLDGYEPGSEKAVLPERLPYVDARRFRHLRVGDLVVMLPESSTGVPGPGFEVLAAAEVYEVVSFSYEHGVVVRVVDADVLSTPRKFSRVVAIAPEQRAVGLVRVLDASTLEPIPLQEIDREVRRRKADLDPLRELEDIGRTHPLTLMVRGAPTLTQRVDSDQVRMLNVTLDITDSRVPAQVVLRESVQGFFSNLTVVDLTLYQEYFDKFGAPARPTILGETRITGILSRHKVRIRSGYDPSERLHGGDPTPEVVRTFDPVTASLQGPVTRGGPTSFGSYAWAHAKLVRRTPPNIRELREDVGRAYADLGVNRRILLTGLTLSVDVDGTVVLSGFPATTNVGQYNGMDLTVATVSTDVPIRISSITADTDAGPVTEATVTLTVTPDAAGSPYTATLLDTVIAQAWKELISLRDYLDSVHRYVRSVEPPSVRTVQAAATRLRLAGFDRAARIVEQAQFDQWIEPSAASEDRQTLVRRFQGLISDLLGRRTTPLDEA